MLVLLARESAGLAFGAIKTRLDRRPKEWELKEGLNLLRQFGIIRTHGHARGEMVDCAESILMAFRRQSVVLAYLRLFPLQAQCGYVIQLQRLAIGWF
jgi:hypothetical protein